MSYYLLYDPKTINFRYFFILTSGGSYTAWQSYIAEALSSYFTIPDITFDVQNYLNSCTYQIIGTYDQLPTIESHPELFI